MTGESDEAWLRPIDPMLDSDAPEQIALELGRRYALYLREAQRLVLHGLAPDEAGLVEGIRAESRRYLGFRPSLAVAALEPVVEAAENTALAALTAIVASAPVADTPPPVAAPPPVRRLALQPSATIVGNMAVRKRPTEDGIELAWDPVPNVNQWTVRVSTRPDPRRDYLEGEAVTLAAGSSSYEIALDDHPRRIQLYGLARDGRIVRRAIVSALTRGNSNAQWKRQATAS